MVTVLAVAFFCYLCFTVLGLLFLFLIAFFELGERLHVVFSLYKEERMEFKLQIYFIFFCTSSFQ